jgi:hypothetical protein
MSLVSTEKRIAPDGSVHYRVYLTDEVAIQDSISYQLITEIRAAESPEEAAAILRRRAPWLEMLATWLVANSDYADWLNLVVAVILHFAPSPADGEPPSPPPARVEVVIKEEREMLEQSQPADAPSLPSAPPEPPATPSP